MTLIGEGRLSFVITNPGNPRDKDGCIPNVRVHIVFIVIVFSRDGDNLPINIHVSKRAYSSGFPMTGYFLGPGVHPTNSPDPGVNDYIPWISAYGLPLDETTLPELLGACAGNFWNKLGEKGTFQ